MPELPDIQIYIEALERRLSGQRLLNLRLSSPFLVRTFDPPISTIVGSTVRGFHRIGKQIVWEFENERFLVCHLMIAGRFHLKQPGARPPGKIGLAAFDFTGATLMLTEASTKKRASLHLVEGTTALRQFDKGGLELLNASPEEFTSAIRRENHTLKRTLTDPRLFSGIGNAYSDEILHRARLSPLALSQKLTDEEIHRLHGSAIDTMHTWIERLRLETGETFPEKVTAFRPEMAVHGKYREPCPVCTTPVQRIAYAENECNYCPRCQTGGKVLADRSLSRLLHDDWPRTVDELEAHPSLVTKRAD